MRKLSLFQWITVLLGFTTLLITFPLESAQASSAVRPSLTQLEKDIATSATIRDAPPTKDLIPPLSTNFNSITLSPMPAACYGSWPVSVFQPIPANATTTCAWGDKTAQRSIFLIGDSQAAMWLPAFNSLGIDLGWKILFLGKPSCPPWITTSPYNNDGSGVLSNAACIKFVSNEIKFVDADHPSVVVPVGLDVPSKSGSISSSQQQKAVLKTLRALKSSGAKVLLLAGFSYVLTYDGYPTPQNCLTIHSTDLPECEVLPQEVATYPAVSGGAAAAKSDNIDVVPTLNLFCASFLCPIFVKASSGDHLVYFDPFHMVSQYSVWISKALESLVKPYLPAT